MSRLLVRAASTSASSSSSSIPFPFPIHSNPTPHQIFHLPLSATTSDVKARYYDLVRIYHPDSPVVRRESPETRHARFQAISSAYDVLRGRGRGRARSGMPTDEGQLAAELERRRRAYYSSHRNEDMTWDTSYERARSQTHPDDPRAVWKDRVMIAVGLGAMAVGFGPMLALRQYASVEKRHHLVSKNLEAARSEAKEFDSERKQERQRMLRTMQLEGDAKRLSANSDGAHKNPES